MMKLGVRGASTEIHALQAINATTTLPQINHHAFNHVDSTSLVHASGRHII
jgi:hypothetical protein